jgi:hypothetical protein
VPSPAGTRLTDGFSTKIELSNAPTAGLWELEVTPPVVGDNGENDTTTMRNTAWRTKQPPKLKTLGDMEVVVQYDPAAVSTIVAQTQVNQSIKIYYPNGGYDTIWGWIGTFKRNRLKEKEPPNANLTIKCSNQDNTGAEVAPTYTPPP